MAHIDTLSLQGIRTFVDPTTIALASPITIICGKNGVGKSTLLEALKLGISGVFPSGSKLTQGIFTNNKNNAMGSKRKEDN